MNWQTYEKQQKAIELGDRWVSYYDSGGDLPVICFLHGIPTWGYLWWDLAKAYSDTHRVIIPDLLGFGFSDKSDRFDRSIQAQEQMLVALMDELNIDRASLVAHDIGGGVALRMAVNHQERIERLAVMNIVCYDSWPIEMMLQFGHPSAVYKLSAKVASESMQQGLKMGFAKSPDTEVLEGLLAPYRTEVGKRSLVRCAAALNTNLTTELTPHLSSIDLPTLILWGEGDVFQLPKYGRRLAQDIPNARFVPIADARHFVMFDQPEPVKQHLSDFFKEEAPTYLRARERSRAAELGHQSFQ